MYFDDFYLYIKHTVILHDSARVKYRKKTQFFLSVCEISILHISQHIDKMEYNGICNLCTNSI